MSDILHRQYAPDTSIKLRLPFVVYCIIILFQVLSVRVLADTPVSADTVDPAYSHIPSKTVNAQIVDSTPAADREFPYMAVIYRKSKFMDGGAILSSQWVLTSARQLVDPWNSRNPPDSDLYVPTSEFTVGYGSVRNETLSWVSISDVWIHPQYDRQGYYRNNLALIKLATPLPSNGKWRPVRITPKPVRPGAKLILSGWGCMEDCEMPSTLRKIRLTVGSDSGCQSGDLKWDSQDDKLLCTTGVSGGYERDEGSSLVLPTFPSANEHFAGYLVGIMRDWEHSNSNLNIMINYFTRVAEFVDLIADVIGVNSSELLATPDNESSWESEDGEFHVPNSILSFPMKCFDDMLLSITLCLLTLATIIFNN
jgi:hypothetical protein